MDATENSTRSSNASHPKKRHSWFYFQNIIFQVDGTLFSIPRNIFARESEGFEAMFTLPTSAEGSTEGSRDEHPTCLDGMVKMKDFVALLKLLFYSPNDLVVRHKKCNASCHGFLKPTWLDWALTTTEWISVLKVATVWSFHRSRATAIEALSRRPLDPIQKICLARDYDIADSFGPAFVNLVMREKFITMEEAGQLGLGWTMKYGRARELHGQSSDDDAPEKKRVERIVSQVFGFTNISAGTSPLDKERESCLTQ